MLRGSDGGGGRFRGFRLQWHQGSGFPTVAVVGFSRFLVAAATCLPAAWGVVGGVAVQARREDSGRGRREGRDMEGLFCKNG